MSTCELDRFVIQTPYIKVVKSCSAPFEDAQRSCATANVVGQGTSPSPSLPRRLSLKPIDRTRSAVSLARRRKNSTFHRFRQFPPFLFFSIRRTRRIISRMTEPRLNELHAKLHLDNLSFNAIIRNRVKSGSIFFYTKERERGKKSSELEAPGFLVTKPPDKSHDLLAAEDRGSRVTPIETRLVILGSAVKS